MIKGSAIKKGRVKIIIEYFIEIEKPRINEYKKSLRSEYLRPISCPKEISNTESPNKIPFGETSSINNKPEGKIIKIEKSRKLDDKACLRINLDPI